ncbi:hypothetical protein [Hymenobacter jeollabukensis]|uniref:YfhO family protein n=1 Tax=Hymenobacter jeollabukensis TaxID=2025313 RepID=A0A5R8WUY9_9BACT|nr:hypothetical protein [Hymenobacter jeollabukensis]TLM95256.1 hypothetical protein FDY95_05570 [Hymenobacter jeollabukensis]
MKPLRWRELLLSLLFYAVLFVLFSWPLAAHFSTAYLGRPGNDANQYVWNAYNFHRQVLAGHNPFFTDLLLYPRGTSLVMHTYTPVIGLLNVPLGHEILAVNVALLLSFTLSGVGAYRLCRRWVDNPVLCLLAGVLFAFSGYKLAHLPDHYHLLLTAPAPFYLYAFLEAFRFREGRFVPQVRRWGQVGLCAALGIITLLSDYYTLFGLLYFSLGYALYYRLRLGSINWRRPRPWIILVVVLVVCHIGSRMLKLAGVPDNSGFWWGGDLAGYLLPPPHSRWLSTAATERLLNSGMFNAPGSVENIMFLGYVLPLLALFTLVGLRGYSVLRHDEDRGGRALPWLALLFFMLTLPAVRVFGKEVLRLPTGLLHYVPFFNNIRCPTRHVAYLSLLLPIVVFAALDPWLRARLRPAARLGVSVGLLGLVLLELQPKAQPLLKLADVPAAYLAAAQLPGDVLFPVPFGLLDGYRKVGQMDGDDLFYQTRHHKKLPGAYISRVPAEVFASFDQDSVMHTLLTLQEHPDTTLQHPSAAAVREFLRVYHPAAFIVAPQFRGSAVHRYLQEAMPAQGYREEQIGEYVLLRKM